MVRRSSPLVPIAALLAILGGIAFLWVRQLPAERSAQAGALADAIASGKPTAAPTAPAPSAEASIAARIAEDPRLLQLLAALSAEEARDAEALLKFRNAAALQAFLARATAQGIRVLDTLDRLGLARVQFDSVAQLRSLLAGLGDDLESVEANYLMQLPTTPPTDARTATTLVPLGSNLLAFLGIDAKNQNLGRGVTVAFLDTGVVADPTFGQGRLRTLDVGQGINGAAASDGHATAVAALAAGEASDARGVAPAASLISVRVTDASGYSDVYTVAQALLAAVDAGAQIVNISLGSYQSSSVLSSAIAYALQRGAVVVASAGNDQSTQLTWPAADPRVVSVAAVDALGQQATFSNSGSQLQIAAPGYGIQTAWSDGSRVYFSGTSASAPIVAGAIAALMSESPGLTASQAWSILQTHASDAGAAGADEDFGNGIVNLGWALGRADANRTDPAIASHHFNSATLEMEFIVQNRSGQPVSGLALTIDAGGATRTVALPTLAAGAVSVITQTVDGPTLAAGGTLTFRSRLQNPTGLIDAVPANNQRTTTLSGPNPGD